MKKSDIPKSTICSRKIAQFLDLIKVKCFLLPLIIQNWQIFWLQNVWVTIFTTFLTESFTSPITVLLILIIRFHLFLLGCRCKTDPFSTMTHSLLYVNRSLIGAGAMLFWKLTSFWRLLIRQNSLQFVELQWRHFVVRGSVQPNPWRHSLQC